MPKPNTVPKSTPGKLIDRDRLSLPLYTVNKDLPPKSVVGIREVIASQCCAVVLVEGDTGLVLMVWMPKSVMVDCVAGDRLDWKTMLALLLKDRRVRCREDSRIPRNEDVNRVLEQQGHSLYDTTWGWKYFHEYQKAVVIYWLYNLSIYSSVNDSTI